MGESRSGSDRSRRPPSPQGDLIDWLIDYFKGAWGFCKILWKWFHSSNWYEVPFHVKILMRYNADAKLCCDKALRLHSFVVQNCIQMLVSINASKIWQALLYQWYANDLSLNEYVEMCTVLRASTSIKIWLKIRAIQPISTRECQSDMCAWMRVCSCACVCLCANACVCAIVLYFLLYVMCEVSICAVKLFSNKAFDFKKRSFSIWVIKNFNILVLLFFIDLFLYAARSHYKNNTSIISREYCTTLKRL